MKVGQIVDAIIGHDPLPYQVKVLKRDDPDKFELQRQVSEEELVSESLMQEALARSQSIKREPFFKKQKGKKFQVILESVHPNDEKIKLCGMADIITHDKVSNIYYLDDIKCSSQMKAATPTKWLWNCKEMGYLRQLAAYKYLLYQTLKNKPKAIVCRHIVSVKEGQGVYKVKLFIFGDDLLEPALEEFLSTAELIAHETKWKDAPVTWDQAVTLQYDTSNDWQSDLAEQLELGTEEEDQGSVDAA